MPACCRRMPAACRSCHVRNLHAEAISRGRWLPRHAAAAPRWHRRIGLISLLPWRRGWWTRHLGRSSHHCDPGRARLRGSPSTLQDCGTGNDNCGAAVPDRRRPACAVLLPRMRHALFPVGSLLRQLWHSAAVNSASIALRHVLASAARAGATRRLSHDGQGGMKIAPHVKRCAAAGGTSTRACCILAVDRGACITTPVVLIVDVVA